MNNELYDFESAKNSLGPPQAAKLREKKQKEYQHAVAAESQIIQHGVEHVVGPRRKPLLQLAWRKYRPGNYAAKDSLPGQ